MTILQHLRLRLPDARDDALLMQLYEDAGRCLLDYTGRTELPEALFGAQAELAIVLYNRMGMEGESTHAEGSVRRSAQGMPEELRRRLNPYRLARAVEA